MREGSAAIRDRIRFEIVPEVFKIQLGKSVFGVGFLQDVDNSFAQHGLLKNAWKIKVNNSP